MRAPGVLSACCWIQLYRTETVIAHQCSRTEERIATQCQSKRMSRESPLALGSSPAQTGVNSESALSQQCCQRAHWTCSCACTCPAGEKQTAAALLSCRPGSLPEAKPAPVCRDHTPVFRCIVRKQRRRGSCVPSCFQCSCCASARLCRHDKGAEDLTVRKEHPDIGSMAADMPQEVIETLRMTIAAR